MASSRRESEQTTPTKKNRRASASEIPPRRNGQQQEHRRPASARRRASQGRDAGDGDRVGRSLSSVRPAEPPPACFNRAFSSLTSIRFRRGESQWVGDSSDSGESYAGSRSLVEEVLNDVCEMFDASPAECRRDVEENIHSSRLHSSNGDSREFDLGSTIFRLASGGGGGRRPEHWAAADSDGVADGPANLDLLRLEFGSSEDAEDGHGNKGTSYIAQRQGLFLNLSVGSSVGSAGSSSGSSELWDRMEDCSSRHSKITEVSPLTAQRRRNRRRRQLVARRCARAVVGIAALLALGGSVGCFVLGKGYDPVVEFLIKNTVVGRWLGTGSESLADSDEGPTVHRTLPARLGDMLPRQMWGQREHAARRNAMIQGDQGGYYSVGQGQDQHLVGGGWNRHNTEHPLGKEDGGAHEEMRYHVPHGRSLVRQDFVEDAVPLNGIPLQGAGRD